MFIAMNRFRINAGFEDEFTEVWRSRESRLHERKGYVSFAMLRGATADGVTLFSSHTVWETRADFEAWVDSEQFRDAHRNAERRPEFYAGPPVFEGFDVVLGGVCP